MERLSGDSAADLYAQNTDAEDAIARSTRVAQETTLVNAPSMLAELRHQMMTVSLAYVEAAQAAAAMINAPTPDSRATALDALEAARNILAEVQSSRWVSRPALREAGP